MLKGLAITPPVIGRISIGKVVEKNGKRVPEKDDEFTITRFGSSGDAWMRRPLKATARKRDHYARKLLNVVANLGGTEMEQALRESETLYRSVVTTLSEGIVLQGRDGGITTCNAAAASILGMTADQMMGITSSDSRWHTIHEDGAPFPSESHPAMVALEEIIGKYLLSAQELKDARAFDWRMARKSSLHKLMMIDMQLVIDTYNFSLYAEIDAAKRKAEAAIVNLEAVVAERTRRLEELSTTDDLTQLGNQRSFFDALRKEVARAERYRLPLTLIYFDVDKFKQLNDQEGHAAGDDLLRLVGETVRLVVRQVDLAFRYGGDEFCVLAPSTEGEGGLQLCQRLADAFRDRSGRNMTFSMGVASVGPDSYCSPDELLLRADQAMYAAKQAGRNQVCLWQDE